MKIGGCSFAFGRKPLREAGQIIKGFGFDLMDLGVCLGNTQIHPLEAAERPEQTALEAMKILEQLELQPDECFVLDFGEPINLSNWNCNRTSALFWILASPLTTRKRASEKRRDVGSPGW